MGDDKSCGCLERFRLIRSDVFACSRRQSHVSSTLPLCKALENRTTRGGRPPETLQRSIQDPMQFNTDSVPFLAGTTTAEYGAYTSAGTDCDFATSGLFSGPRRPRGLLCLQLTIDIIRLRDSDVLYLLSLNPAALVHKTHHLRTPVISRRSGPSNAHCLKLNWLFSFRMSCSAKSSISSTLLDVYLQHV